MMAPKGHWTTHSPQEMHLLASMLALRSSPMEIALTGQPRSQGRMFLVMAP